MMKPLVVTVATKSLTATWNTFFIATLLPAGPS
jgi:ABC-type glycerol-3-phosphate transport system permease component